MKNANTPIVMNNMFTSSCSAQQKGRSVYEPLYTTDALQCSLLTNGRSLHSFTISGIESLSQLLTYVRRKLSGFKGIITLSLRNSTQGWSRNLSLCLL